MKNESVYLRMSPELKKSLKELADKDKRTLSDYLRITLSDHVEKMQQKKD